MPVILALQAVSTTETINRYVTAGADDAEEDTATGAVDLTSSDLELYKDSGVEQLVGLRFQNVTIPQGATIDAADVEFTVDETAGDVGLQLRIWGQLAANAGAFTTTTGDISGRTKTTAAVDWSPPTWDTIGAKQATPSLVSILQEIVNQGTWASGNSLVILVGKHPTDATSIAKRVAESYEGADGHLDPDLAPKLAVTFTA